MTTPDTLNSNLPIDISNQRFEVTLGLSINHQRATEANQSFSGSQQNSIEFSNYITTETNSIPRSNFRSVEEHSSPSNAEIRYINSVPLDINEHDMYHITPIIGCGSGIFY